MAKNTGIKLNRCMEGFKKYIESLADMAYYISEDPTGPSPMEAIEDVVDIGKTMDLVDTILGASKMFLMLKPTLKSNLDALVALHNALKHPKKMKYWKQLASSVGNVGKLTLANPLVLFPTISPLLATLSPANQAVIIGALKILSSFYFYATTLADKGVDNEKIQEIIEKFKPFLPDTGQSQSKKS